jgi:phosphatidate cytidylyltransferase
MTKLPSSVQRLITAGVLIPLVLLLVLRAPVLLLAAVAALVALLGVRELMALAGYYGVQPMRGPTYAYVSFLFVAACVSVLSRVQAADLAFSVLSLLALGVCAPFVFLALGMARPALSSAYGAAATSVLAVYYVAAPLALLVVLRQLWAGWFLVLYLLLVVWSGDIFAYYAGRALGRHKLAPRISPGKTWEGTVASLAGATLVGWAVFTHLPEIAGALRSAGLLTGQHYDYRPPAGEAVALSACVNVAAQVGDLVESLIKRGAGVKDSGALLPGHGGVLDRIDALLFAAPVLWCYAALRVSLQGHF